MNSSIDEAFHRTVEMVHSLPKTIGVSYDHKLQLYGLYKYATVGPVNATRPNIWEPLARSKFDAWKRVEIDGYSTADAKLAYCQQFLTIAQQHSDNPLAQQYIRELQQLGIDGQDESSDDDQIIDLPSKPSSSLPASHSSTSLVAKARQKRLQVVPQPPETDSEDEQTQYARPITDPEPWVAQQRALSRNSHSSQTTIQPGLLPRPPSRSQSSFRMSLPRPSSRPAPVAVEHTLQNISASLMKLHDRIAALEQAQPTQPPRPPTPGHSLFRWLAKLLPPSGPRSLLGLLAALGRPLRDAVLIGALMLLLTSWRQRRSVREVWRGWRAVLGARRRRGVLA